VSEERLNQLEDKVNNLKSEKIRTEERLKILRKQKEDVTAELASLGVAPKDLDGVISELSEQIRTSLTEIDAQITKTL